MSDSILRARLLVRASRCAGCGAAARPLTAVRLSNNLITITLCLCARQLASTAPSKTLMERAVLPVAAKYFCRGMH